MLSGTGSYIEERGFAAVRIADKSDVNQMPVMVKYPSGTLFIGRDFGAYAGSSKSHTTESLESCGAEVQKGNAPEERKLQRLFRNPEASKLIKRCNDFGAGGVSVARRRQ